jgi:hypothetical protein
VTTLLKRVAQLIALASSPEENEARSAAHMACALIREHKMLVGMLTDDGGLSTIAIGVVSSPQAELVRPRRRQRTAVTYRCASCGIKTPEGGLCADCRQRRGAPRGVWTVDCDRCGRSAPSGDTEKEANDRAFLVGFRIGEAGPYEGQTLCPRCAPLGAR